MIWNKTTNPILVKENSLLKKSFAVAAIGFLLVCAIGYLTSHIVDSTGIIRRTVNDSRFDFSMYQSLKETNEMAKLAKLSIAGIVIILISSILNIFWSFRYNVASKPFVIICLSLFIIGQGIGFGMLFVTWNAADLLIVFGIAGGLFGIMAIIGFFSKNLMPLGKVLFMASIAVIIMASIAGILYATGVYNDTFIMFIWVFTGFLTLAYTAFDVWWIKQHGLMQSGYGDDKEMEFRLVAFFGFRLLSDLISLIWTVARIYARSRR